MPPSESSPTASRSALPPSPSSGPWPSIEAIGLGLIVLLARKWNLLDEFTFKSLLLVLVAPTDGVTGALRNWRARHQRKRQQLERERRRTLRDIRRGDKTPPPDVGPPT